MSLQAIVDENKQVIFDDNGNIFVYNSLNNCATYMEDTAENRNLLNMPLQNDEMIGQGSNANCSADKTKDDGPRWTHDKILLLFSLYKIILIYLNLLKKPIDLYGTALLNVWLKKATCSQAFSAILNSETSKKPIKEL
ncbi:hypothetical protein FQA39_LY12703 [Lamprigera yunnana]|nr:hypothetical protein FQA39_LY12703 [Lamprigera yunnana]